MKVSPLIISMALHYHCKNVDYGDRNGDNNYGSPAVQEAFAWFVAEGMLTRHELEDLRYRPTAKLHAWVGAICNTPQPVQRWVFSERDDGIPVRHKMWGDNLAEVSTA